jgi:predicted AAA+ superfamily ATPase
MGYFSHMSSQGKSRGRYVEKALLKDLDQKMVLLSGPRQCGKTTFSKWLLSEKLSGEYLNWDQIKDRKKITQQEWSEDSQLLVLDEVHKKPKWKTFLKGIFDTKPESLRLLVTGSARLEFFQKSGDSMLGRYLPWRLHPFCLGEDPLQLPLDERFERFLNRGGFPAPYLATHEDDVQRWRLQRWNLLLREDLRDLESVRNIQQVELLAELLRAHASGMLSYSNLAEDVQIAPKTAKNWVHTLEKLYLIFLVTPYAGTLKRSLSKTPKVYFTDPGDLMDQSEGARIENVAAVNLVKRLNYIEDAYGDRVGLHYLRDKEGREVDFVITLKNKPVALIEIKKTAQEISPALLYFKERLGNPTSIQLHTDATQKAVVRQGVHILPLQVFFDQPIESRTFWKKNS